MATFPKVWTEKIPFILLMVGSIIFYGITIFSHLETFKNDYDLYTWLAVNLRVNGIYGFGDRPTAYRPPLYPILLAGASYVTGLNPESADTKADIEACKEYISFSTSANTKVDKGNFTEFLTLPESVDIWKLGRSLPRLVRWVH